VSLSSQRQVWHGERMMLTKYENPKANSYRDLVVWQKGIALAKLTYSITARFPSEEKFGLVSQMRRAAVSISSNIAEGQARHTKGEFILFISHAQGSVAELDTQLHLAAEIGLIEPDTSAPCVQLLEDIRRMLNGLSRRLSTTR
jgi:four helix bundle protein